MVAVSCSASANWGGERLREDARWVHGAPPVGNANYGWIQHILWHLAPGGRAGVVLANGSMSSGQSGEDVIRRRWSRPTWWIAWSRCPASSFTQPRFPPACGSSPAGRTPGASCATVAARCCSSTPGSSAPWWTGLDESFRPRASPRSPTPTMRGAVSQKRAPTRTCRASARRPRWTTSGGTITS